MFKNLEFLFLQAGTGCVSSCFECSRRLENYEIGDQEKILNNLREISKKGLFGNNTLIYNHDFFDFEEKFVLEIIDTYSSISQIYFHTNLRTYKNTQSYNLIYQRDLTLDEETFLIEFINTKIFKNIFFVLWYDKTLLPNRLIRFLQEKKLIVNIRKDYYSISIEMKNGNRFYIYQKDGEIKNISECYMQNFKITTGSIDFYPENSPKQSLEVLLNGDIRVHDLPCGKGNLVISNIWRGKDIIYKDFSRFQYYIEVLNQKLMTQKDICTLCNKTSYTYI